MVRIARMPALLAVLAAGLLAPQGSTAVEAAWAREQQGEPIYLVYYWRARPGKAAEYAQYIRTVAEPIDEDARKAGVFEEVRTYAPAIVTGAVGADWTHMRVFKLRSYASLDGFSAGMDAATRRRYPDEGARPRADDLRDLVRQEIWRDFR